MRLIDADKLYPDRMTKDGRLAISTNQIASAATIENAPTIDSLDLDVHIGGRCCGKRQRLLDELRPKGKWTNGECKCPCCGEDKFKDLDADIWADWQPNFCPNCGADMRGEMHER